MLDLSQVVNTSEAVDWMGMALARYPEIETSPRDATGRAVEAAFSIHIRFGDRKPFRESGAVVMAGK